MGSATLFRGRGVSLISMLVGLVLGLIAVLSMMSVYKGLVFRGTSIRVNAKQDTQVGTGLIAAHLDIQKVGYGVEANPSCVGASLGPSGAANTDLVLISSPVLATPLPATSSRLSGTAQTIGAVAAGAVTGSAVVWHWVETDGANRCSGLVATNGGLVRLAPMNCTNATQWNTLTWTMDSLIEAGSLPGAIVAAAATASTPIQFASPDKAVVFGAQRVASCTPFGAGVGLSALQLTITAGNSTSNLTSQATLCLPNLCQ